MNTYDTPANRQVLEADFMKLRPLVERGVAAMSPGASEAAGSEGTSAGTAAGIRQAPQRTEQLPLW